MIFRGSDSTTSACGDESDIVVDLTMFGAENCIVSTNMVNAADPVELADSQAVIEHLVHGRPLDPNVRRRVQERAAEVTERLRREYGTLDIAVDLVRQVREE
jgi:hypothetical protein